MLFSKNIKKNKMINKDVLVTAIINSVYVIAMKMAIDKVQKTKLNKI